MKEAFLNNKILFLFILLLLIEGCDNPTNVAIKNPVTLNPDNLTAVEFNLTSYNTIEIKSDSNLYMNSRRVIKILIGEYLNGNIIVSDSLNPEYIRNVNDVLLNFNGKINVSDSVIDYNAGIKFVMRDTSDVILHKQISMLTYKYVSARLVIKTDEFSDRSLLDFYYNYPTIYYRQSWTEIGYKYNLVTRQNKKIIDATGAFLDANSSYLFSDENFSSIVRYNIIGDSLDLISKQNFSFNTYGIGIIDTVVYIVTSYDYGITLRSYTLDLQPINSIPLYAGDIRSMTYYKGKFLTVFLNDKLASFDPGTGHFYGNPTAPLPTKYTSAVKVYKDSLYFNDYKKRCIGVVPVKDVFPDL